MPDSPSSERTSPAAAVAAAAGSGAVAQNRERRRWLIATSVMGGAGGAVALVPLVESLQPSARVQAQAAPQSVDLSALQPGQMMTVAWRGLSVWIVHRTPEMLAEVLLATPQCADPHSLHPYSLPVPDYCRGDYRSRPERPEILVLLGICTHLGCTPAARFQSGEQPNLPSDWPGGWWCPCHGSTFDLAGRVFRNKPATRNLDIPRYMFDTPARLLIGRDEHGEA